jgi:hypothetical protein
VHQTTTWKFQLNPETSAEYLMMLRSRAAKMSMTALQQQHDLDFARLIGILSGEDDVRTTFIGSALSRAQLDFGISKDSFWDRLMAVKFNDYQINFETPGLQDFVAEVPKEAAAPLRPGSELKRWY